MAFDREGIDEIFEYVSRTLDISDKLFSRAEAEYKALGDWISEQTSADDTNNNYEVEIYPQGSFALGTVIKPISDEDDYDLDILCEMKRDYGFDARFLKCNVVLNWLRTYREIKSIVNKRRCWHVEYKGMSNFHMDVIPSVNGVAENQPIKITEHYKKADTYRYVLSNPYGYRCWFLKQCQNQLTRLQKVVKSQSLILAEAEIEQLSKHRIKTHLQRSIQLLKRHRDVIFNNYPDESEANDGLSKNDKPISIIITTLAGECCSDCDSIIETLSCFSSRAESYLNSNFVDGKYHVTNPSYTGENFADKWNENPNKKQAFDIWLHHVAEDFREERLLSLDRTGMFKEIKRLFGENIGIQVIKEMQLLDNEAIKRGEMSLNPNTGMISASGVIRIPSNHHYHC